MNNTYLYIQEFIWLLVSVLFAIGICYPVTLQAEYLHLLPNFLIVFLSLNYIRYIVTFKKLWFLKPKAVRVGWFIINIYLFIYLLNRLEVVLTAIDSVAVFEVFINHTLRISEEAELVEYIKKQYTIFTMASFLGIILFNIRLLVSFWSTSKVKKEKIISTN